MITDPIPRAAKVRRQYEASDAQTHLVLPPAEPLQNLARALAEALATEQRPKVKKAGANLLAFLAQSYDVAPPKLSVLGARPKTVSEGSSYELWGDYTFATQAIRVWMRTAVLGKVTSFRGLLNTILHEPLPPPRRRALRLARYSAHARLFLPHRRPLPSGPGHARGAAQAAGMDQRAQHLAHRLDQAAVEAYGSVRA